MISDNSFSEDMSCPDLQHPLLLRPCPTHAVKKRNQTTHGDYVNTAETTVLIPEYTQTVQEPHP